MSEPLMFLLSLSIKVDLIVWDVWSLCQGPRGRGQHQDGQPHSPEAAGGRGHHVGTPEPQARQAGHPRSGVQLGSPQTKDEALPSSQALFPFCTHGSLP